jgi:hypothetical protein
MMRPLRTVLVMVTLLLTGAWLGARASTIYDNTTTRIGSGLSFTAQEQGSQVNAAGTDRLVTDLFIGMSQQGMQGTGDVQARLYANDGAGGRPGTMLWQGPLMQGVHFTGGIDLIDFAVPMVPVPDTFTWTVQISNTNPVAVGLPTFGPPTAGGNVTDWFGNPVDGWTQIPGDAYMARVDAVPSPVPEPGTASLLLIGLGGVLLWRVRAGRRRPPTGRPAA